MIYFKLNKRVTLNILILVLILNPFRIATSATSTLGSDGIEKIYGLLKKLKPVQELVCKVKTSKTNESRFFLNGEKKSESLFIHFFSKGPWLGLMDIKMSFLPSDLVEIQQTVHSSYGEIEEIMIYGHNSLNGTFVFQHDGKGHLIWAQAVDDLRMVTCHVKKDYPKDPFLND